MSYDYSSESRALELPNPYRLQNLVLWVCALMLAGSGVLSLSWAREALQGHALHQAAAPLLTGLVLLVVGLSAAATAARRLRFFFGRGRPASVAPEIPSGVVGGSQAADAVKDMLRQGGISYPEPQGAVEGLLYHWVPSLITAPLAVQAQARKNMFNLLAIAATLVSFGFSWLLFGTEQTRPWIGILYFLFGAFFIVRPILGANKAKLGVLSLVGLIAAAILAPVLIGLLGRSLPSLGGFTMSTQTTVMLVTALVACALALLAVLAQVDSAPQTRASVEQCRLSMNAPPSSLLDELDRTLQSQWTERIPNRRYARIDPQIDGQSRSGSFAGELLEESQPLPRASQEAPSFASALSSRRHRSLVLMDLYAIGLTLAAVILALVFVRQYEVDQLNRYSLLGTAAILGLVASLSLRSAAMLWGRFDFESCLIWVEMVGSYQTSRIGTGNQFSSRLNTENDVVRTEAMTLRVWRARIESVVFGKDAGRQITAMFSTEKEAKDLAAHLVAFAQGQSVLVAPSAATDQARIAALGASEHALQKAVPADASAAQLQHDLQKAQMLAAEPARSAAARFCSDCGTPAPANARFCSGCGVALAS